MTTSTGRSLNFEALVLTARDGNVLENSDAGARLIRIVCYAPDKILGFLEIDPDIGICSFIRMKAVAARRRYRGLMRFFLGLGAAGLILIVSLYFLACGEYACALGGPPGALLILGDVLFLMIGAIVGLAYGMRRSIHKRSVAMPAELRDAMRVAVKAYRPAAGHPAPKRSPVAKAARTAVIHTFLGPVGGAIEKAVEVRGEMDHAAKLKDTRAAGFPPLWNAVLGDVYDIHQRLTGRSPVAMPDVFPVNRQTSNALVM